MFSTVTYNLGKIYLYVVLIIFEYYVLIIIMQYYDAIISLRICNFFLPFHRTHFIFHRNKNNLCILSKLNNLIDHYYIGVAYMFRLTHLDTSNIIQHIKWQYSECHSEFTKITSTILIPINKHNIIRRFIDIWKYVK